MKKFLLALLTAVTAAGAFFGGAGPLGAPRLLFCMCIRSAAWRWEGRADHDPNMEGAIL